MSIDHQSKLLISAADLAKRLSLSRGYIHQVTVPRGTLKPTRIGRRVMYHPDDVQEWLRGFRNEPTKKPD